MAPDLCFCLFFFCLFLCFVFVLKFTAYALLPSAHERGEVRSGIFFFFSGPPCCFKLARGSIRNL